MLTPTDTVFSLPVEMVHEGKRVRPVDPIWAAALGRIMAQEGQHTPIEICDHPLSRSGESYLLVAGAHRLEGARLAGMVYIKAVIVDADAQTAKMREVSENLWRRNLSPIDRAAHVAELHQLLRVRDGVETDKSAQAIAADARWQKLLREQAADANDTMSLAYGWTSEIADQLGFNKKTIERDLLLHRRLLPAVADQLRGHPIATNAGQLRALARLDSARQREAAELIASGAARNVSGALAVLDQKIEKRPEQKRFDAFLGSWDRMSSRERWGILAHLYEKPTFARAHDAYLAWVESGRDEPLAVEPSWKGVD